MGTNEVLRPNGFREEPLREEDIPSLLELEQQAFPFDQWSEDAIRKEHSYIPQRFTVIKYGTTVVAYVHTQVGYDNPADGPETDGIIESIAVLREYRRMGLGERLIRFGIDQLKQRGAQRILFRTRVTNKPMIQLGLKLGFHPTQVIHNFYPSDDGDALEMKYTNTG